MIDHIYMADITIHVILQLVYTMPLKFGALAFFSFVQAVLPLCIYQLA